MEYPFTNPETWTSCQKKVARAFELVTAIAVSLGMKTSEAAGDTSHRQDDPSVIDGYGFSVKRDQLEFDWSIVDWGTDDVGVIVTMAVSGTEDLFSVCYWTDEGWTAEKVSSYKILVPEIGERVAIEMKRWLQVLPDQTESVDEEIALQLVERMCFLYKNLERLLPPPVPPAGGTPS